MAVLRILGVAVALLLGSAFAGAQEVTADEAVWRLMKGYERYKSGRFGERNYAKRRDEQKSGQHPYAIILTCSDSRVPPELIFDEDLGRLFVVRVAGNVIDPVTMGSIEYAVEHLKVPLLLVLGHTRCGAVNAAFTGAAAEGGIGDILARIQPACARARKEPGDEAAKLLRAIEFNAYIQMSQCLKNSHIVAENVKEGKLRVLAGMYDIETGEFHTMSDPAVPETAVHAGEGPSPKPEKGPSGGPRPEARETGPGEAPPDHPVDAAPDEPPSGTPETDSATDYRGSRERMVRNNIFTDGAQFCVQVAAFRSRSVAEAEASKLREKGRKAFVLRTSANGTWYRVRVGGFATLAEAETYQRRNKS